MNTNTIDTEKTNMPEPGASQPKGKRMQAKKSQAYEEGNPSKEGRQSDAKPVRDLTRSRKGESMRTRFLHSNRNLYNP